jgi:DNA-binding NarL/FixJ family response regulator
MEFSLVGSSLNLESNGARATRVVLADDECLFRTSLRQLLSVPPAVVKDVYGVDVGAGFEVVGEAGSGEDAVRVVQSIRPDLLLLDLSMPRLSGLEALRLLDGCPDGTRTMMLTGAINRNDLFVAVQLGARGVLLKDSSTELLFEAMVSVMTGRYWLGQMLVNDLVDMVRTMIQPAARGSRQAFGLTPREREVLAKVVAGFGNKEIAREFAVSEETIKHHLTRMFDKVGVSNRTELASLATQHGIVDRL